MEGKNIQNMKKNYVKKAVPPDGGWGWVVCLGCGLISLSLRSLDPSFGLLFGDLLRDLKIDSVRTSVIISVLDANINFSGLFVGYLLKKYSYRKVAFFGSLLNSIGLILTSRASSLSHIIITYSIIGGLGTGVSLASSFVALNSFFVKRRGQALGFSMAGTSLGMMLMPQVVQILLRIYGFRGTTLLIGGISLHSLAGACLLSPVPLKRVEEKIAKSLESSEDSSTQIIPTFQEDDPLLKRNNENDTKVEISSLSNDKIKNLNFPRKKSYFEILKDLLGLNFLSDLTYMNIMIGLCLIYVADTNFKLITPFFLINIGLTKKEVAFCLSLTAFMNILARLFLPTLFEKLGFKKRSIVWICSLLLGIGRSVFAEGSHNTSLLVVTAFIGFLRGVITVNLNLIISEKCSLEILPYAFGFFMVLKGTFVVFLSPLIGYVRDVTSSYRVCIHLMTGVILLSFIIWGIEFFYEKVNLLRRRKENVLNKNNNYRTIWCNRSLLSNSNCDTTLMDIVIYYRIPLRSIICRTTLLRRTRCDVPLLRRGMCDITLLRNIRCDIPLLRRGMCDITLERSIT
ncbi:monocarboxylate transporter 12-like [Belonocnema kinseyi]|uniref:monocarboxylate transporter 12-like n=1 Tax=Belonocnema kinseyi TaxID=2817044 RepID=UPI00143DC617|nr:monocarboxylate transporter 12-like [Belonocnema kinseyi]